MGRFPPRSACPLRRRLDSRIALPLRGDGSRSTLSLERREAAPGRRRRGAWRSPPRRPSNYSHTHAACYPALATRRKPPPYLPSANRYGEKTNLTQKPPVMSCILYTCFPLTPEKGSTCIILWYLSGMQRPWHMCCTLLELDHKNPSQI